MKRLLCFALLSVISCAVLYGQATGNCSSQTQTKISPIWCSDSQTITSSGSSITIQNNGGMNASFEELFSGSPSSVSVVVQGCGVSGTCDTLNTNTTATNAIISPTIAKIYKYFMVTATFSGGTNPSVEINTVITTAINQSSGGGGTTTSAVTFNNLNTGASSGTTFNGSAAVTVSTNTLGAFNLAQSNTVSSTGQTFSGNTATGTPVMKFSGTQSNITQPMLGFTGTFLTTSGSDPLLLFEPSSATAPTWGAGTIIGADSASGWAGNFLDFHVNGASSVFTVAASGSTAINSSQTVVSCSTSGTATFVQPLAGAANTVRAYLASCVGTASYTFPSSFNFTPAIMTTNEVAASVVTSLSTTAMTVTGATTTGFLILEGY